MIEFDPNTLLSYYQTRNGSTGGAAGSTASAAKPGKAPTAPWRAAHPTSDPDLAKAALRGGRFVDPNAAKLDVPGASSDYRNMFALYTGLQTLQSLAEQMQNKTTTGLEKTQIQKRFGDGLLEVQKFLTTNPFKAAQVVQGAVATKAQGSQGVPAETDTYTTGVLYTGAADGAVPAFQGAVAFSMTLNTIADGQLLGTPTTVNFDLAEMGSIPRTMSNVVVYLNGKLSAAGVHTRFANVRTEGAPQTMNAGGKTITLPAGPDSFALQIKGDSTEQPTLAGAAATPAVYLAQSSGLTDGAKPNAVRQLLKYDTNAAVSSSTTSPTGRDFAATMGPEVQAVRSTLTGADGSIYVLADVNAKTGGQSIDGAQDVALMKYDSMGKLLFTRTLGAANSASGFAMALSSDGKQLALAGSITGALDTSDPTGISTTTSDSLVSVYDADAGDELWTQRRGASADDKATAVTFGADGTVYVAGTTSSAMPGAAAQGGSDGYLAAYSAQLKTIAGSDPSWVASTAFVTQFGGAQDDRATGVAVAGSSVVVSAMENGHAVLRRYDLQATGAPVLGATRDLGDLQGGNVAGVAFNTDGSLIVAGSTHNGALAAGTATTAFNGGEAGFVAKLSANLGAAASDRVTYLGTGADQTADAFTLSGGQVFVAGRVVTSPPSGSTQASAHDGYIARVDPTTGAIGWSQTVTNTDKEVAPTAIAVDATGASVLDRLGLPKGTIDYASSQKLVANTSLRPGDSFYVRRGQGGARVAVTIEANDTLTTLADKVQRASGYTAKADTVTLNGAKQLHITPLNDRFEVALEAGPSGRDALESLGLTEGLVSKNSKVASSIGSNTLDPKASSKTIYALQLPSTLNLDSDTDVKHSIAALANAVVMVRKFYSDLTAPPKSKAAAAASGTVPAYLKNQIANYQTALQRLNGG